MKIFEELKERGLIAQVTDESEIRELINEGGARFYIGFDPTADSLHVGHFMALCLMKRLQMAGNKPVVLLGGGTGHIGDPTGRTDMRSMMTAETIEHNCQCFKKQMERFIEFGDDKALIVNNADWLLNLNYMIMQAYDFWHLSEKYGCNMQFGGDDQWSNMLAGTELIRKKSGKDAYAMTITLLLNSEGKKMGKTAKGAVWLDENRTSPYEFYQYWRNVDDNDVMKCIRMLTFIPVEEIREMDKWEADRINEKKEILAYELTRLVHGEEKAQKAQSQARAAFGGGGELPEKAISVEAHTIIPVLVATGICASNGEARRLIQQGGVSINESKVTDINAPVADGDTLHKGKKVHLKVRFV